MARRCTVCDHPDKAQIDAALLLGQSITGIASSYGLSRKSVGRHKRNHLKALLPQVVEVVEPVPLVGFDELITEMKLAKSLLWQIIEETLPEKSTGRRDCLAALRQLDGKVELLGKLQVAQLQQTAAQYERQAAQQTDVIDRSHALEQFSHALDRAYGQDGDGSEGGGVPA